MYIYIWGAAGQAGWGAVAAATVVLYVHDRWLWWWVVDGGWVVVGGCGGPWLEVGGGGQGVVV